MARIKMLNRVTKVSDISFDDFYDNLSNSWQQKAQRLQARRWRKLKHQLL